MNPQQPGMPGDVPMVLQVNLFNAHPTMPLTIISGEFSELNKKIINPNQDMIVALKIPQGYREFIKETSFKQKNYLYVGLRDKDAADPMVIEPNI